jgi:hypothetical protein
MPILTKVERTRQTKQYIESDVIKAISSVFKLNTSAIFKASLETTGEKRLSLKGLNHIYHPIFPAVIRIGLPHKGKGRVFTLNRLLNNPEKFPPIAAMLQPGFLEAQDSPVILVGFHPRVTSFVAVTTLSLQPAPLCYSTVIKTTAPTTVSDDAPFGNSGWEIVTETPLVIGGFKNILQAMKSQELWQPEM